MVSTEITEMLTSFVASPTVVPPAVLPTASSPTPPLAKTLMSDLLDSVEDEEKELRRQERVEKCGALHWVRLLNENGRLRLERWYCGTWRMCPRCAARRAWAMRERVLRFIADDGSVYAVMASNNGEAKGLSRKYSKSDYLRLPQEGGSTMFFVDAEAWEGGTNGVAALLEGEEAVKSMDWDKIVVTPEKAKTSGDLGKREPKEEKSGPHTQVNGYVISDEYREAMEEAYRRAVSLTPPTFEDGDEWIAWLEKRQWWMEKGMREAGVSFFIGKRHTVYFSDVSMDAVASPQIVGKCVDLPVLREREYREMTAKEALDELFGL